MMEVPKLKYTSDLKGVSYFKVRITGVLLWTRADAAHSQIGNAWNQIHPGSCSYG